MSSTDNDESTMITVIHCWSAPRSRSTALLYSFESRGIDNTIVLDEPLYRRWLEEKLRGSASYGITRPYATNLINGTPPANRHDEEAWRWEREKLSLDERIDNAISALLANNNNNNSSKAKKVIFIKHIAKFASLFDFETNSELLHSKQTKTTSYSSNNVTITHKHVLLIRDPLSVITSWTMKSGHVHNNNTNSEEVGLVALLDIYSKIIDCNNNNDASNIDDNSGDGNNDDGVIVIDSDDLATHPSTVLRDLCNSLHIDYTDDMLHWKRGGPHDCDGPWAEWWYGDVWDSDGWDNAKKDNTATNDDAVADGDLKNNNNSKQEGGVNHPRTQKYKTVPPHLLPLLRMSYPAYEFLKTRTVSYQRRNVTVPPSGRLFEDERNEHVLVYVGSSCGSGGGRIVPREMARVSPFDSSVQGGDATWEGIRVYNGRIFHLEQHLNRLFRSAKALGFTNMHTRADIIQAIFRVLAANGMRDGAHMRLTLTRGEKCTSSMNPRFNVYGTTLIILPEWKPTEGATTYDNTRGISLITAGACRRSPPSALDNKIHHNNMIQNILPKIQANNAGAADAIMLDVEGFVAETNATNLFMVRYDWDPRARTDLSTEESCIKAGYSPVLVTPTADACLPGITRDTVLLLAKELGIDTEVRRVSLSEFYSADEVFTTGTMGELTPVTEIDGRTIGDRGKVKGAVTDRLQKAYKEAVKTRLDWSTEIPDFC